MARVKRPKMPTRAPYFGRSALRTRPLPPDRLGRPIPGAMSLTKNTVTARRAAWAEVEYEAATGFTVEESNARNRAAFEANEKIATAGFFAGESSRELADRLRREELSRPATHRTGLEARRRQAERAALREEAVAA